MAGHHDPEHKPKDFSALVLRLNEIHRHIQDEKPSPRTERVPIEQEFHDLVGWIEEFASDSDLDETNWRRCKHLKDAMDERLGGERGESFEQFTARYVQQMDAWQKDIAVLVELSSQSRNEPLPVEETLVVEKQPEQQP